MNKSTQADDMCEFCRKDIQPGETTEEVNFLGLLIVVHPECVPTYGPQPDWNSR